MPFLQSGKIKARHISICFCHRYDSYQLQPEIQQQSLLPGVKDPNLWTVKCKIGEEKATVIGLMRKAIAQQYTDEPLQIKSAVAVEGLKGYIYIEAFKQTHVKTVRRISTSIVLFFSQWYLLLWHSVYCDV